jgi:beta-phosphoglucomutase-like phosphatase (HAD superfamily)
MLGAIIFDFDGVIADSEPIHLMAFQHILRELGYKLTPDEYYANYLGYDDRGFFRAFLAARGQPPPESFVDELVARKSQLYGEVVSRTLRGNGHQTKLRGGPRLAPSPSIIFPGVQEFVREASAHYPLAIASGALRHEIEQILACAGLREQFAHITSAEDVCRGKPDPEPFLHALAGLNRHTGSGKRRLAPADCLVIEDSLPGIRAAHAAGMKVLAVANTHAVQDLREAEAWTHSLADVRLQELAAKLWQADCAGHGA